MFHGSFSSIEAPAVCTCFLTAFKSSKELCHLIVSLMCSLFFWYTETKKTRKCRLFLKLLRGFIIAKTSIPELDFKSTVFCKNTICIILWIKFFVLLAEKKNYTRSILLISKLL